jgi:hypothetical protein
MQTHGDVSKMEESCSFEIPITKFRSKQTLSEGLSSGRKELFPRVWNEGSGMDLSRGMATKLVHLEERKNEVRAMGKSPSVLALMISTLKPIFALACGG